MTKASLRLVRCADCTMIFGSPVADSYVDGSFYEDEGRPFYLSPEKLSGDYSPVRFARELKLFRKFCLRGKVLDVGCSTGAFLHHLKNHFPGDYQTFGTDVSGPALEYAEGKGVRTISVDFLSDDFPETGFDVITLWAVLEHVSNPKNFVEQAARLLKTGGICFALVPNWNSLARRLLNTRYRYILDQHINYFTPATLRRLMQEDFKVEAFAFTHFNPFVIQQDFRDAKAKSGKERAELLQTTNRLKTSGGAALKIAYWFAEKSLSITRLTDNVAVVLRKEKAR